jgi:hypothetical protein
MCTAKRLQKPSSFPSTTACYLLLGVPTALILELLVGPRGGSAMRHKPLLGSKIAYTVGLLGLE